MFGVHVATALAGAVHVVMQSPQWLMSCWKSKSSSTTPSQSLSMPSHISKCGVLSGLHTGVPPWHDSVPCVQAPTFDWHVPPPVQSTLL